VPMIAAVIVALGATMRSYRRTSPDDPTAAQRSSCTCGARRHAHRDHEKSSGVEDRSARFHSGKRRELFATNRVPARAYNLAFAKKATIGVNDGVTS